MSRFKKASLILVALGLTTSVNAAVNTTQPINITNDNSWHFNVTPYLWAINLNGTTEVGRRTGHVNDDFSDILHHLDWGGMLWLEASHDQFSFYLNNLYAVLSDDDSRDNVSVHIKNKFGIFGGGISYEVFKWCAGGRCSLDNSAISIAPYAGFRYTLTKTTLDASDPDTSVSGSVNEYWTDPTLGARLRYQVNRAWSAVFYADIGGLNASSQYSYNVTGVLGYKPNIHWANMTAYAGYRILDQYYTNGSNRDYFKWDMKIFGPIIGLSFDFD